MIKIENPPRPKKQIKIFSELLPLGTDEALMVSDLINKWIDHLKKNTLDDNGYFNYSRKDVTKRIGKSKNFQYLILKILEEIGIIEIKIFKKSKGKNNIETKRLIKLNLQMFSTYSLSTYQSRASKIDDNLLKENEKFEIFKKTAVVIYNILLYYIYHYYDNTNVLSTFNNKLLNVSNTKVLSLTPKNKFFGQILFFNSLGNLRKHNRVINNKTPKTFKQSLLSLELLEKGKFFKRYRISHEFLIKHNILNPINKQFTDKEVKRGFMNLSLLVEDDYGYVTKGLVWPNYNMKEKIKKLSIHELLFNKRSGKSWFLIAFYNKPIKISDQLYLPFDEKYLHIFESVVDEKLDFILKQKLIYTIKNIIKAHSYLINTNDFEWNTLSLGYEKKPENFLNTYLWYIRRYKLDINLDSKIKLYYIQSRTFWNSFCDYIRDEFCIKNTENAKKMF